MADISKRIRSSWVNSGYGIMKTATDTITTLPTVLYPTGTTATVGLKGNTVQSGTRSPQNPVMPNGTGERTANVMPAGELKTVESNGVTFSSDGNGRYRISGTATAYASVRFNLLSAFTTPISVSNGGQGTLSFFNTSSDNNVTFNFYNGATKVDAWKQTPIRRITTTYNAIGNKYIDNVVITVNSGATVDITITPEFTNDGVLPSEFEPYGIKIPISSANTTTPVYLGGVQTTRKIKKLVLTGGDDENWSAVTLSTNDCIFRLDLSDYPLSGVAPISTHYTGTTADLWRDVANNEVTTSIRSLHSVGIHHSGLSGVPEWKTYLQQQYAAGTPVTVWYVLATEETAVVNEPLMKIGEYADEISGITIPVTAGGDTFSVDTTVQPSEATVNYKGWHPVADVHERDNGAWT